MSDKPTLIQVTDPAEIKLLGRYRVGGDLDLPCLFVDGDKFFALADEYRAWKSFAPTSQANDASGG